MELRGDAQRQVHVQAVVVRLERPRVRPARVRLENGRLSMGMWIDDGELPVACLRLLAAAFPPLQTPPTHLNLEEALVVEHAAQAREELGAQAEGLLHLRVHDQVRLALPVALVHVREPVPLVREREQRLGQHLPAPHVHRHLALLRPFHRPPHANDVTGIRPLLQLLYMGT